jgi:hypothetical protein
MALILACSLLARAMLRVWILSGRDREDDYNSQQKKPIVNAESRPYYMAQAVKRWLPTAVARIRAQVKSCGIRGGQSGTWAGFLRVLRFPLPILIPPNVPLSSSIIRGWYNRPKSGRRTKWTQFLTQFQETKKKTIAESKPRWGPGICKAWRKWKKAYQNNRAGFGLKNFVTKATTLTYIHVQSNTYKHTGLLMAAYFISIQNQDITNKQEAGSHNPRKRETAMFIQFLYKGRSIFLLYLPSSCIRPVNSVDFS